MLGNRYVRNLIQIRGRQELDQVPWIAEWTIERS